MEWDEAIDLSKRKMSSRLIVERALARGWKVCGFPTIKPLFLLYIPGRETPVRIYSASPPQMSYAASKIAKDKAVTNALLQANGLPVPEEIRLAARGDMDTAAAQAFLAAHQTVVVKPLDASHGKGITVNVSTAAHLDEALQEAAAHTERSELIVQEQVPGIDVRVVCIGYKYADAISRLPASVVGNGIHTVKELVDITNGSDERGANYSARLNTIPQDRVLAYLGADKFAQVPQAGETVQVIGVSNVGMGGERHNIRQDIPLFLQEMAIKAARTLELPVCGIDFMVKRLPQAGDTLEDLQPKIIEANECPMLTMYEDLQSPEQLALIDRYLDYVASY